MRQLPEPEAVIIAIVDDDPSVRRGPQWLIRSVGWKPETCASAQEFVARSRFPSNFRPIKGRIKWRGWLVSDTSSGI
jgi:hypothetical protein